MSLADNSCIPEILGHKEILKEELKAIYKRCNHHAICLTGPVGIGKSLVAKELGKAFLCPEKTVNGACGICRSCRRINLGTHPDWHVLEPFGPKARGVISVEDIRNLEEKIWLKPGEGVGRVIIIEDAHLMPEISQNTLLKTLEEPPSWTLFILIAQKLAGLLPTVISRCQVLRLSPLSDNEVKKILLKKGKYNEEDIELAVAYAKGSPGQGIVFLEGGGKEILKELDNVFPDVSDNFDPFEFVERILENTKTIEIEEITHAQKKRQIGLLFLKIALAKADSLLNDYVEDTEKKDYYFELLEKYSKWTELCIETEKGILENLEVNLVLEVMLLNWMRYLKKL